MPSSRCPQWIFGMCLAPSNSAPKLVLAPPRRRWHLPGPPHDVVARSGQSVSSGAASLTGAPCMSCRQVPSPPRVCPESAACIYAQWEPLPLPPAGGASPFRLRNKRPFSAPLRRFFFLSSRAPFLALGLGALSLHRSPGPHQRREKPPRPPPPALRSTWSRGRFLLALAPRTNRRGPASRDPWPDTVRQDRPALGEDAEWALNHSSHAELSGATARWALDAAFSCSGRTRGGRQLFW